MVKNFMSNAKEMTIHLIVGLIKMESVNVDLSNYATKTHLKNITYFDTSNFAVKTNLPTITHKIF